MQLSTTNSQHILPQKLFAEGKPLSVKRSFPFLPRDCLLAHISLSCLSKIILFTHYRDQTFTSIRHLINELLLEWWLLIDNPMLYEIHWYISFSPFHLKSPFLDAILWYLLTVFIHLNHVNFSHNSGILEVANSSDWASHPLNTPSQSWYFYQKPLYISMHDDNVTFIITAQKYTIWQHVENENGFTFSHGSSM